MSILIEYVIKRSQPVGEPNTPLPFPLTVMTTGIAGGLI